MIYRLFLALLLSALTISISCPKYKCNATTRYPIYSADPQKCAVKELDKLLNPTFKLTNCPTGQYCQFNYSTNISYCVDSAARTNYLFPGDSCARNENCVTKLCSSNVCAGLVKAALCTFDYECNPGLFCNKTKKCDDLREEGKPCGKDIGRCKNELTCNLGICAQMGSLDVGIPADNALACKSLFTDTNSTGTSLCSVGPSLESGTWTTVCTKDNFCKYKVDTKGFLFPCRCGLGSNNESYCPPGLGQLTEDINLFFTFAKAAQAAPCHIETPWFCPKRRGENKTDYHKAFVAYMNLSYSEMTLNNDPCVTSLFARDYWDSWAIANWRNQTKPSFGKFLTMGFGIILTVFVALIL